MRSTKCQLVPNEHSYMQFASMHSHKHTLAPRMLNCAPMHLESQNSALNGSHLHQCLLRHSKCTQPTQIKCSINQMCTNTPQWLKSRLTMLECALMQIQCFQIPPKSTNQALVHLQIRNGLQNLKVLPKLFKTPPRLPKTPPKPSKSANLHLQHTQTPQDCWRLWCRWNIDNGVVDIRNNVLDKCIKDIGTFEIC